MAYMENICICHFCLCIYAKIFYNIYGIISIYKKVIKQKTAIIKQNIYADMDYKTKWLYVRLFAL